MKPSAKSVNIRPGTKDDHGVLLEIWDRCVRATHHFLSSEDIEGLYPEVRDLALPNLELWVLVDDSDGPVGFMGLNGADLDALFLDPGFLRRGGGTLLVNHARTLKGPLTIDVNEQNPEALKFYQALGFRVTGRSELDSGGRPFPLLHLEEDDNRP